jgi:beta-mannosidase
LLANAVPVLVGPNTGAPVWRRAGDQLGGGPDRYLSVRSAGAVFPTNRHFFTPIKDLVRTPGSVSTSARQVDAHTIEITLTATGYAYFVHLIVPHEGTRFSDNYFDLESGETRQVTVWNPAIALTPDMIDCRSR